MCMPGTCAVLSRLPVFLVKQPCGAIFLVILWHDFSGYFLPISEVLGLEDVRLADAAPHLDVAHVEVLAPATPVVDLEPDILFL